MMTKKSQALIILVIVLVIAIAGIVLYLVLKSSPDRRCGNGFCDAREKLNPNLCPEDCKEPSNGNNQSSDIQPYFIAIHTEPTANIPEMYGVLKEYIKRADEYNIKLTLMFSDTWADYIAESPERMDELQEWEKSGHEIAGHHHSIYHSAWDGYTDYTLEEARAQRINQGVKPEPYLGTMDDFMAKLKQINPNMNSGCMNNEASKKDLPDEIIYDTCSGLYNLGEPGRNTYQAADPEIAKNEYVSVGIVNGVERKWLTHGQITDTEKQQAAKEVFETTNSGVLGAVTHATKRNDQNTLLLDFLDFVHEKDPTGSKSMTLTEIIESGILPEEDISVAIINAS